jgi:hypothetical protein
VCVCVCVCVCYRYTICNYVLYVYMHMYTCIHTYVYSYVHIHIYVCMYVCIYICMYMYIYIYTVCPPPHRRCPDCCVPLCSQEVGGSCDARVLFTTAYYEDICTAAGGGIDETSYTNFVWKSRLRQSLYFCTSRWSVFVLLLANLARRPRGTLHRAH